MTLSEVFEHLDGPGCKGLLNDLFLGRPLVGGPGRLPIDAVLAGVNESPALGRLGAMAEEGR